MFGWAVRRTRGYVAGSADDLVGPVLDEESVDAMIRAWCDEQVVEVEQRLFRFGVSGTLVSAHVDTERGSVLVTNSEGRSLVIAAPSDTATQIASMLHGGPVRYHVASSTGAGTLAVIWVWTRSRSRCFVASSIAEVALGSHPA